MESISRRIALNLNQAHSGDTGYVYTATVLEYNNSSPRRNQTGFLKVNVSTE